MPARLPLASLGEFGGGRGAGWGAPSSCPELGDRKGLRAKQEKPKFPFPWFPGLVPAVGEEAGWGAGFLSPNLQFGGSWLPRSRLLIWEGSPPVPRRASPHTGSSPAFWAGGPRSPLESRRVGKGGWSSPPTHQRARPEGRGSWGALEGFRVVDQKLWVRGLKGLGGLEGPCIWGLHGNLRTPAWERGGSRGPRRRGNVGQGWGWGPGKGKRERGRLDEGLSSPPKTGPAARRERV